MFVEAFVAVGKLSVRLITFIYNLTFANHVHHSDRKTRMSEYLYSLLATLLLGLCHPGSLSAGGRPELTSEQVHSAGRLLGCRDTDCVAEPDSWGYGY